MPAFGKKEEAFLRELAKMERYIGVKRLTEMFEKRGFKVMKKTYYDIDHRHGTWGVAMKKVATIR